MNKQTKLLAVLGFLSLLIAPSISHAQRQLIKGEAVVRTAYKAPELTRVAERAVEARNIQRSIAGARLMTGTQATRPPLYPMEGNTPAVETNQTLAHIAARSFPVTVADEWSAFRTQLMDKYDLTTVDAQAVAAGTHNNLEAVEEAISHGAKPEMALFGALSQGYLELADKIAEECEINVNAVLFDHKTILELLPDFNKHADKRLGWLLEHGLNPDLVMTSGMYQQIKGPSLFKELVDKGLNPMAAFGKTNYTALHWYAEQYHKLFLKYDTEGNFLVGWVAKFPKTNVNAQDVLGNTPAHYVEAHTSSELDAFGRLRGFDPLIENKEGLPPEQYQNGCTEPEWHHRARYLRRKIEEMIYMYKYDVLFPTLAQRNFAYKKSTDYLHNPDPKKLIEYLVSLGATPQDIAETLRPLTDEEAGGWNTYSVRLEILKVLFEEYGVAPAAQEPVNRWHEYLGPYYDESL